MYTRGFREGFGFGGVQSKISYDWYYRKRVIGNIYNDYVTS